MKWAAGAASVVVIAGALWAAFSFIGDKVNRIKLIEGHLKVLKDTDKARTQLDNRMERHEKLAYAYQDYVLGNVIEDFEDKGARWEISFEDVRHYQFPLASREALRSDVAQYSEAVRRFDHPLEISCEPEKREATLQRLEELRTETTKWMDANSRFLQSGGSLDMTSREGPPLLMEDFRRYVTERSLWPLEDAFAAQYVSFPGSGELVKGHRIVLADLGLVPYEGKAIRDARLFDGAWSKDRRGDHILCRLAFVQEVFRRTGNSEFILYRGYCGDGVLEPPRNTSFVSATFSFDVAKSCFGERDAAKTGILIRRPASVERLFMTFFETAHMNRIFKEAEAVLLFDSDDPLF